MVTLFNCLSFDHFQEYNRDVSFFNSIILFFHTKNLLFQEFAVILSGTFLIAFG